VNCDTDTNHGRHGYLQLVGWNYENRGGDEVKREART